MANRGEDPVAWQAEDFRARAKVARAEAHTLVTRAEIWDDAAGRLEDAIEKARRTAASAAGSQ